jgi:hypothetical protein
MTKADLAPLFEIPAGTLNKGDVDYLDGLPEALAEFPDGATESGQGSAFAIAMDWHEAV